MPKNLWRGECSPDFRVGGAVAVTEAAAAAAAFRTENPGTLRTCSNDARPPIELGRQQQLSVQQLRFQCRGGGGGGGGGQQRGHRLRNIALVYL